MEGYFIREPRDAAYRRVIRAVAQMASVALFSVGGQTEFMTALEPWCTSTTQRSEWPGYRLVGATATIKEYGISEEFLQLWESKFTSLYEQDIAFLRSDGSTILYVVAHEKEAYLFIAEQERSQLAAEGVDMTAIKWL
jgi:hypothetical protein